MNGHRAFQHYLALKKHFTEDRYSVFDAPRVFVPEATFLKRNEHYLWEKFAARFTSVPELMTYMIANIAAGHDNFVFDQEAGDRNFTTWTKRSQSATHLLEMELENVQDFAVKRKIPVSALLQFQGASPPLLLNMYLGGHICLQSMVILNSELNYLKDWKGSMSFLFEDQIRRLDKSQRFVKFNKDRVKKVIESFKDDLQIVV